MGFLDLFKSRSQAQIVAPASKKSFFASVANQLYSLTDNYQGLAQEGYAKNPYMFACVDQRASNLASLPIQVREGERIIENADILALFTNAIYNNENISLYDFFYFTSCFLDLAGEVYFYGADKENPAEIVLLNPSDVEVRTFGGSVDYYIGKKKIDKENEFFLCIKSFNPIDRYEGLAPASAAALSLDTNNAGRKYNSSLLQKHTKVSAILKGNAGEIPAEMREQFRNDFKAKVGGPTNAGDVLFMSGDIDYVEGQMRPVDMDWSNAMDLSGKEIAMAFKVPLELLGIGKATYENVKEAKLGFMQQTVLPQMQRILTAFQKALLPENQVLEVDLDNVEVIQKFRQDAKRQEYSAKADFSTKLYGAGIITQNEAREALGLEGISGGDIVKPSMPMIMSGDMKSLKAIQTFESVLSRTERLREKESLKLSRKLAKEFRKQEKAVMEAYEKAGGDLGVFRTLIERGAIDRIDSLSELLTDSRIEIISSVGSDLLSDLRKSFDLPVYTKETEGAGFNVYATAINDWVSNQTAKDVTDIDETTEKQIGEAVKAGIENGEGAAEIADRISGAFKDNILPVRSMLIARTEVTPAMNFAHVEVGKQIGIPLKKVWLAYGDTRVRDTHLAVSGTAVDMDSTFNVGFSRMGFAGDRTYNPDPAEVVNCRCTVGYKEI